MTTIDDSNYEQWLLLYAEGELTEEQRSAVESWLSSHTEAAEELAYYNEAPRLKKDEQVRYAATLPPHTVTFWPAVWRWSAAAAVVVAMMLPVARLSQDEAPAMTPEQVAVATEIPISTTIESRPISSRPMKTKVPVAVMEPEVTLLAISDTVVPETIPEERSLPIDPEPAPEPVYCDHLIVYAPAHDTLYSDELITYTQVRPSLREVVRELWSESRIRRNLRRHAAEFYALGESTVNFSD